MDFKINTKFLGGLIFLSIALAAIFASPKNIFAARSSTPVPTLKYEVPFHRQEHSLSCEAASLKMMLAAKGMDVSESDIISKIPFGPMWSDSDLVFVGDINGRQFVNGYGIHWDALANVARNY